MYYGLLYMIFLFIAGICIICTISQRPASNSWEENLIFNKKNACSERK